MVEEKVNAISAEFIAGALAHVNKSEEDIYEQEMAKMDDKKDQYEKSSQHSTAQKFVDEEGKNEEIIAQELMMQDIVSERTQNPMDSIT